MMLYLSEKRTPSARSTRDQPSGTLMLEPNGDWYGTKTWLSGMSPGGFFSGAIAVSRARAWLAMMGAELTASIPSARHTTRNRVCDRDFMISSWTGASGYQEASRADAGPSGRAASKRDARGAGYESLTRSPE